MNEYTYDEIYEGADLYEIVQEEKMVVSFPLVFKWNGIDIEANWGYNEVDFLDIEMNEYIAEDKGEYEADFTYLDEYEFIDFIEAYNDAWDEVEINDIEFSFNNDEFLLVANGRVIEHISTGTLYK